MDSMLHFLTLEGQRCIMLKNYLRHRMADHAIDDISDLMNLSGVSRGPINKLYRNQQVDTVKLGTLLRLCDALGCKLSDLVEYSPEE